MENNLFEIDRHLYEKMRDSYTSEAEREFFEQQHSKALNECTDWELLIDSNENQDGLYLIRYSYTEYELGVSAKTSPAEEIHTMTLADVLSVNLKKFGFLNRDITLLDWFRERDYKGIRYDRDKENL